MNCSVFNSSLCAGKLIPYAKSPLIYFGTISNCSEPCNGVYLVGYQQTILQISLIAASSISSVCSFIALLVFAVNFRKIHHPEASMYYVSLSCAGTSISYIISLVLNKNDLHCSNLYKNSLNDTVLLQDGLQNSFCAGIFAILYYFTLASWTWWTAMNCQWVICSFKMTLLKWKWTILTHVISWTSPLPLVIISLSLRAVSGNSLMQTCWISNQNNGYYQLSLFILPMICFIILNSVLLTIGFFIGFIKRTYTTSQLTANLNPSTQSNNATCRNSTSSRFTVPHLLRITSYSVLVLIINGITFCCYFYEYIYTNSKEIKYLQAQVHLSMSRCYPDSNTSYIDVLIVALVRAVSSQLMSVLVVFWLLRKELLCFCCELKRQHDLNTTITSSVIHSRSISIAS